MNGSNQLARILEKKAEARFVGCGVLEKAPAGDDGFLPRCLRSQVARNLLSTSSYPKERLEMILFFGHPHPNTRGIAWGAATVVGDGRERLLANLPKQNAKAIVWTAMARG